MRADLGRIFLLERGQQKMVDGGNYCSFGVNVLSF
jgi:hypothetical protein